MDLVNQLINDSNLLKQDRHVCSSLLAGRRILVTGGGTGLGKGMAAAFLKLGAEVHICGRRKAVCDETATELMAEVWRQGDEPRHRHPRRRRRSMHMVEAIFADGPLTDLINNAAGNFISRTQDLSPRGFDAVANIVMHGTFYVTHAVGKRWIAGKTPRQRGLDHRHLGAQRQPLRGAVGHEQVGDPRDDDVAGDRMGPLRHPPQHHRARRNPDRGHEQAASSPATRPARAPRRMNPMGRVGTMEELQNLAIFLISGGCDWINGETIAHGRRPGAGDGRQLL